MIGGEHLLWLISNSVYISHHGNDNRAKYKSQMNPSLAFLPTASIFPNTKNSIHLRKLPISLIK